MDDPRPLGTFDGTFCLGGHTSSFGGVGRSLHLSPAGTWGISSPVLECEPFIYSAYLPQEMAIHNFIPTHVMRVSIYKAGKTPDYG